MLQETLLLILLPFVVFYLRIHYKKYIIIKVFKITKICKQENIYLFIILHIFLIAFRYFLNL